MADDAVLIAVANFAASLAPDYTTTSSATERPTSHLILPGPDTKAKKRLELELQSLAARIRQNEGVPPMPVLSGLPTPNEHNDTIFGSNGSSPYAAAARPSLSHNGRDDVDGGNPSSKRRRLQHDAADSGQDENSDEPGVFSSSLQKSGSSAASLTAQMQLPQRAIKANEYGSMAELEKELLKHQKANEAFQKVLREIGQIITAVARGDLTMKVHMNDEELDPEINNFKRTINAMMDQLQTFAREVSRVAREVGTEGLLGGQAIIDGIDGTWKELTDNGKNFYPAAYIKCNSHLIRS